MVLNSYQNFNLTTDYYLRTNLAVHVNLAFPLFLACQGLQVFQETPFLQ